MADNTTANAGAGGDTFAANDLAGIKYQRVKPSLGAAGTAVDMLPVVAGLDSTATGIAAAGLVAQLDDVATTTVTENQFAPVRLSTRRALLVEGVASGTAQPVSGTVATTIADGADSTLGAQADAAALSGTHSLMSFLKGLVTLLPQALGGHGALIIEGVASGTNINVAQATAASFNAQVQGPAAHGASTSGNPLWLGQEAIAHGTNPTAVTAGQLTKWYANRAGVPFVLGGHPNIITIELAFTAAQTDVAIVAASGTLKYVITRCSFFCSHANTVDVAVRVGYGATNTPTTTGVVLTHPNVAAGSGVVEGDGSGMLGISAASDAIRVTATAPTTGSARVLVSYYSIES